MAKYIEGGIIPDLQHKTKSTYKTQLKQVLHKGMKCDLKPKDPKYSRAMSDWRTKYLNVVNSPFGPKNQPRNSLHGKHEIVSHSIAKLLKKTFNLFKF